VSKYCRAQQRPLNPEAQMHLHHVPDQAIVVQVAAWLEQANEQAG
jgi:predicted nucleotidyltransferase